MKKLWGWLFVVLLVIIGVLVAGFSVYRASLEESYVKLGMSGSGHDKEVVVDEVARVHGRVEGRYGKCESLAHLAQMIVVKRGLADFEDYLRMSEERLVCGTSYLARGWVRAGTLEVVKSGRYLNEGLLELGKVCNEDKDECDEEVLSRIELVIGYYRELELLSRGRVKDVFYEIGLTASEHYLRL